MPINYFLALTGAGSVDAAGLKRSTNNGVEGNTKAAKLLRMFRLAKLMRLSRLRVLLKRYGELRCPACRSATAGRVRACHAMPACLPACHAMSCTLHSHPATDIPRPRLIMDAGALA